MASASEHHPAGGNVTVDLPALLPGEEQRTSGVQQITSALGSSTLPARSDDDIHAAAAVLPATSSAPTTPTGHMSPPKVRESELPSDTGAAYALIGLGIPTSARPEESPPAVKRAVTSPAVTHARAQERRRESAKSVESEQEAGRMGELKRFTLWETKTVSVCL